MARDAAFQRLLGGEDYAARVVRERAGHAFDPAIATLLADDAGDDPGIRRGRLGVGRDARRANRARG